jgi:hypothetical protein
MQMRVMLYTSCSSIFGSCHMLLLLFWWYALQLGLISCRNQTPKTNMFPESTSAGTPSLGTCMLNLGRVAHLLA